MIHLVQLFMVSFIELESKCAWEPIWVVVEGVDTHKDHQDPYTYAPTLDW